MNTRTACASGLLLLGSLACAGGEAPKLPEDLSRVESELVERASRLLERYGTTFYALAAYVDSGGRTREVVPERSAPLEQAAIGSALREAFVRIPRADVLAAGLILDVPDAQAVRIQLEAVEGVCYELTRAYSFERDGRVAFREPSTAECSARLLPDG